MNPTRRSAYVENGFIFLRKVDFNDQRLRFEYIVLRFRLGMR